MLSRTEKWSNPHTYQENIPGALTLEHTPILIDRAVVEQIESFKFLGVHITNKLTWSKHTKTVDEEGTTKPIPPQ